jgi:hypothetical protein
MSSVKCVVVDKKDNKKCVSLNVEKDNYYKKCGFRNNKDFGLRHSWKVKENGEDAYISVFSKNKGRANSENKCELPPPVDNDLYFGSFMLVMHKEKDDFENDNLLNLTIEKWEETYEKLCGGFEDLGEEDSYSSEEEIDPEMLTKEGYSKEDGFIVDDDDEEEEELEEEEQEYTGEETDEEEDEEEDDYDDDDEDYESDESYIASELEEEEYLDTDDD